MTERDAPMIRICPERDARCPHGMDCPHSIDRYRCDIEASRKALASKRDGSERYLDWNDAPALSTQEQGNG